MLLDLLAAATAFVCAFWLRFHLPFFPPRAQPELDYYLRFALVVGVVSVVALHGTGVYRRSRVSLEWDDLLRLLRGSVVAVCVVAAIGFVVRGGVSGDGAESYSRLITAMSWACSVPLYIGWRLAWLGAAQALYGRGWALTRVLILGVTPTSVRFYHAVNRRGGAGYQVIGFLTEGPSAAPVAGESLPVLGPSSLLPQILQQEAVREVVAALEQPSSDEVARIVRLCGCAGVAFRFIPDTPSLLLSPVSVQEVAGFPVFTLADGLAQRGNRALKRAVDLLLSLVFAAVALPLGVLLAWAIRWTSKGPVLFTQERVGKDGLRFRMYKFRSMVQGAEERFEELRSERVDTSDPLLRCPHDPRVTPVGRFMRRFSLDELPQLINVAKGEMSLVGPRPHVPSEVACYKEWQRRKFDVLPGITGLTQVSGRRALSLDDMTKLDIYYMENWSVWLDLRILLQTIPIVLSGRGAY